MYVTDGRLKADSTYVTNGTQAGPYASASPCRYEIRAGLNAKGSRGRLEIEIGR